MNISVNLENNRSLGFSNEQQVRPMNSSGDAQRPQSLDAALDALVKSMTDGKGQVNSENPLVKLLTELLEKLGAKGGEGAGGGQGAGQPAGGGSVQDMSPKELKNALSELLQSLTGNSGAGNGLGGGGAAGGTGNGGGGDMLSSLLGAMAQEKLGSLLTPSADGSGGATFSPENKELMKEVAQFMDQHPETFGAPDNADGKTKSWSDEINETDASGKADTFLDGAEASKFQDAIAMLGQSAASGAAPASGMLANSGIPLSPSESSGGNGGGGGFGGGGGGGLGGANLNVTISADDLLKLLQGQGGNATQGAGPSAQDQALQQDASQAAGSIMNKLFS